MSNAPTVKKPDRVPGGIKRFFRFLAYFLLIAFLWYAGVRCLSPLNQVIDFELAEIDIESTPLKTLRLGTYNIAHGRGGVLGASKWDGGNKKDKVQRMKDMGDLLKQENLDILILNEVDFSAIWSGQFDQARVMAETMELPVLVEQRNIDAGSCFVNVIFGNAILSRFPLAYAEAVRFPAMNKKERVLAGNHDGLLCTFTLPDGEKLQVMAVHLEVRSEATRIQCAMHSLELKKKTDSPLVVLGDFNSSPTGYEASQNIGGKNAMDILLAEGNFITLPDGPQAREQEHYTFSSENPKWVIDWILSDGTWIPDSKKVLTTPLSDHLPVVMELRRRE
jgi:endonuclease/exonuclease/phosphatase family metal-dependent hydrolase